MPLLARMLTTPLASTSGAARSPDLAPCCTSAHLRRRDACGRVGPGQGERDRRADRGRRCPTPTCSRSPAAPSTRPTELRRRCGERSYDAVVGIGGGKTIDVAKYAATRAALPMVAVATNLAHDGIGSPVAILDTNGKGSYGVHIPIAVVVDLDFVERGPATARAAPASATRSATSAPSPTGSWRTESAASRSTASPSRSPGPAPRRCSTTPDAHRRRRASSPSLAEALILRGMAMAVCGTSRPCSGALPRDHARHRPAVPRRRPPRRAGRPRRAVRTFLRGDERRCSGSLAACLERHGLPRDPGRPRPTRTSSSSQAVLAAPATRPDRYTILEHLAMDEEQARRSVAGFVDALRG